MKETYGLNPEELRIQSIRFINLYISQYAGMTALAKGGCSRLISNVIDKGFVDEHDTQSIQRYARHHGYALNRVRGIVEAALPAWHKHIEKFINESKISRP